MLGFPLALIAIRPSVAQASPRLEEAARSLGQPPLAVFRRVTLPLIAPGLAAAVSIVFLSSVTELTATLVLRPTGTETLATRFWTYSSGLAYGAAAPYAALMIAISAIPTLSCLVRWFDALSGDEHMSSTLTVQGVAKSYGSTAVLSDVDLIVPTGGFAAVLGPSGSGKTTLLRLIAGFDQPDRGRIALNGDTFDDRQHHVPAHRRGIGYVPQEGLLFPHLSVAENVGFGLPRRRRSGQRVTDLLELIGLGGLGERRPHELSGGQQQRVAVARALAPEPRLMLLDEPFAGARRRPARQPARRDQAAARVTRRPPWCWSRTTRKRRCRWPTSSPILYDGRIVQHATPRAIYQQPETLAIAHFLGDTNLVAARFNGGSAHTLLGELPVEPGSRSRGEGLVLIRPEQILLTPTQNGHRPPLTARVTAVTYFGHDAIARLSLETGAETLELIARTRGDLAPRVDAHVTLAFDGAMRTYNA